VHFGKLGRGEIIGSISGVLMAISVFMKWYGTDKTNGNSKINGMAGVDLSAWQADHILRFLFLAAAAAPLILAYVVLRDHQLSWPRGELTAVVSVATIVLVLVVGFVIRPGDPRDTISLEVGWFVALVASVGMLIGATQRSSKSAPPAKPPGVM
jgi:hypothetical protein